MSKRRKVIIGGDVCYVGFVGVDRKSGHTITEVEARPRNEGRDERTARFTAVLGLEKTKAR